MKSAFVIVSVCVLAILNGLILQKEQLIKTAPSLFLELTPADPRSLMQGDYMALNYKLLNELRNVARGPDANLSGYAVVATNEDGIGTFRRLDTAETPLAENEHRIQFRVRGWRARIGAESFFFQEGQGPAYALAKYGELKVASNGECVLVGLRDHNLHLIKPAADWVPAKK